MRGCPDRDRPAIGAPPATCAVAISRFAYGSCRTCGKRTERVSHKVLGKRGAFSTRSTGHCCFCFETKTTKDLHVTRASDDTQRPCRVAAFQTFLSGRI